MCKKDSLVWFDSFKRWKKYNFHTSHFSQLCLRDYKNEYMFPKQWLFVLPMIWSFLFAEAVINKCSRECCFIKYWHFYPLASLKESFVSKFTGLQLRTWLQKNPTRYTFLRIFRIFFSRNDWMAASSLVWHQY